MVSCGRLGGPHPPVAALDQAEYSARCAIGLFLSRAPGCPIAVASWDERFARRPRPGGLLSVGVDARGLSAGPVNQGPSDAMRNGSARVCVRLEMDKPGWKPIEARLRGRDARRDQAIN